MTTDEPAGKDRAPSAVLLAVAGSAVVATAFGMARYGYGLLLPDIQGDLTLGVVTLGAIGTLAYVAYLAATSKVASLVDRLGQRVAVVVGGALAVVGTVVIAMAAGPLTLGAGVMIAGASAGLVYAPFGEAVQQLAPQVRARTLATINCGTGWGVAIAAPIAILAGDAWRLSYLGFAACAAVSTTFAARALPKRATTPPQHPAHNRNRAVAGRSRITFIRREAWPVAACALLIGLGSAAFWTYAVDHVREAGLDQTSGRILLGVAGVASLTGLIAADVITRLGSRATFIITALLEAASIAVIAIAGNHVFAVLLAAAVFGFAYNTIVAIIVLWSIQIYSERPAAGVATATGFQGIGLLAGPLTGGLIADVTSLSTALLLGAAVLALTAVLAPRHNVLTDHV